MLGSSLKGYRTDIQVDENGSFTWSEREPDTEPGEVEYGKFGDAVTMAKFCTSLVKASLPRILEWEAKIGYIAIEEYVDYQGVFPFAFSGKVDAQLKTGTIRDVKTTGSYDELKHPSDDTCEQLGSYVMPWWAAGEPIPVTEAVVIPKMGKHEPVIHPYQMTSRELTTLRDEIVKVAGMISAGWFPKGDGFYGKHDFDHGLPSYKRSA